MTIIAFLIIVVITLQVISIYSTLSVRHTKRELMYLVDVLKGWVSQAKDIREDTLKGTRRVERKADQIIQEVIAVPEKTMEKIREGDSHDSMPRVELPPP